MSCQHLPGNVWWSFGRSGVLLLTYPFVIVTIILGLCLLWACAKNSPLNRVHFLPEYLLVFLPGTLGLVVLVFGCLVAPRDAADLYLHPRSWPLGILVMVVLVQGVWSAMMVAAMKGFRWFALAVGLSLWWYSICASVIAGLVVNGDAGICR